MTVERMTIAAEMLSRSLAGGAWRPGIVSGVALLGAAGAAATAEATAGATAEGIGALARAVETMDPTEGPAGKIEGNNGGKTAGSARAVTATERRVSRRMVAAFLNSNVAVV